VEGTQLFAARVDGPSSDEAGWIPLTPARGFAHEAAWSPGGNQIYYFDGRDGFRCLWSQRWDTRAARPLGAAVAVQHFHAARRSPLAYVDRPTRYVGLSVARDRLFFTVAEMTSQLWASRLVHAQ
jgi:hypothetical protein